MATVDEMITKVQQDTNLREALQAAPDQDGRIAAFRAAGLQVSAQDLANAKASVESAEKGELSDADLERVAGGNMTESGCPSTITLVVAAFG